MSLIPLFFVFLLVLGLPIAFVLGISAIIVIIIQGVTPLNALPEYMFVGIDSFPLMAIPFFVLTGEIMRVSGLSSRLVKLAQVFVGRIPGGLAQVNILTSIFFAGITGSACADTAAIGSLLIPTMEKEGYSPEYSAAVTGASSCIGPIIPPSIILVVYGISASVSVSALLIAGIIPGMLMGVCLGILAYFQAIKYNFPCIQKKYSLRELLFAVKKAIPALLMPIIIVGGILSGVFTPTEAACVAVVYSISLGFATKKIKVKQIPAICINSAITTSVVLFIISTAKVFSFVLIINNIPMMLTNFLLSLSNNPIFIILLINVLLIIVGCFMDSSAAVILLVPLLLPVAKSVGMNPVHFGIVMCVNLALAEITPPMGPVLFIACRIAKISIEKLSIAIFPFFIALIIALLIITFSPNLVMFLPSIFIK